MAENDTKRRTAPEETQSSGNDDTADVGVNTDDRDPYDWESKYPENARTEMRFEAIYIGATLLLSVLGLFLNWCGCFSRWFCIDASHVTSFEYIGFFFFSGLLGGTVFGVKYFYRVIARGFWSQDRKYWRIFSPWISSCIALIVGCMVLSGCVNANLTPSTSTDVCIGFIAGYFADDAVSKMSEVAKALFGTSSKAK